MLLQITHKKSPNLKSFCFNYVCILKKIFIQRQFVPALWEKKGKHREVCTHCLYPASQVTLVVKNLPANACQCLYRESMEKAREFKKNIYLFSVDYTKAFDCVDHNKVENSQRDENSWPSYLPPKKPVCSQEVTVRTGYVTTNWFKTGKGVHQGCILSSCLFNFFAEYIMWHARVDESQARNKIVGRNINNLRYAYDTTLMAESEEKLKTLLIKVKEESEKADLKLNVQKTKIMASSCIT